MSQTLYRAPVKHSSPPRHQKVPKVVHEKDDLSLVTAGLTFIVFAALVALAVCFGLGLRMPFGVVGADLMWTTHEFDAERGHVCVMHEVNLGHYFEWSRTDRDPLTFLFGRPGEGFYGRGGEPGFVSLTDPSLTSYELAYVFSSGQWYAVGDVDGDTLDVDEGMFDSLDASGYLRQFTLADGIDSKVLRMRATHLWGRAWLFCGKAFESSDGSLFDTWDALVDDGKVVFEHLFVDFDLDAHGWVRLVEPLVVTGDTRAVPVASFDDLLSSVSVGGQGFVSSEPVVSDAVAVGVGLSDMDTVVPAEESYPEVSGYDSLDDSED